VHKHRYCKHQKTSQDSEKNYQSKTLLFIGNIMMSATIICLTV